jgi:hypothetical protein
LWKWYLNTTKQSIKRQSNPQTEYQSKIEKDVKEKLQLNTVTCSSEDNAFSSRLARGARAGVGLVSRKKAAAIGRAR